MQRSYGKERGKDVNDLLKSILAEKGQEYGVLDQLGIPMSNAVGMFLRQVVIQRGIPFEMKLPESKPLFMGELTKEQFNAEIQKGLDDIENGRVYPAGT